MGADLQYHLTDLREYTEYTFWVSAYNENGEGAHSDEVPCRTYSDTPADPPQNVTIESASSTSIIGKFSTLLVLHNSLKCNKLALFRFFLPGVFDTFVLHFRH